MPIPIWRLQLLPASFRGALFHVENNSRQAGRRVVLHEFPKRDIPYAEDMGRKARAFPVAGYVIGPFYKFQRDLLVAALETEGAGLLVLPTLGQWLVQPREYSVRESRNQGGMAEFDMQFVEAGQANFATAPDSQSNVNSAADNAEGQTVSGSNGDLGGSSGGTVTIGEPEIGTP
jgi:prophage DNA circulation protein